MSSQAPECRHVLAGKNEELCPSARCFSHAEESRESALLGGPNNG